MRHCLGLIQILLSTLRPLAGAHFNNGVPLIPPAFHTDSPDKWIVFEGGLAGAFYYMGLMQAVVDRYGKGQLSQLGFAGASSGAWVAGYSLSPIHSSHDVRHWALDQMALAPKFWRSLPLGMLFAMPLGVKYAGMWAMRTSRKFPSLTHAVDTCKYLIWLTHLTPRAVGGRWPSCGSTPHAHAQHLYRSVYVVKSGSEENFGDACAATGLLPMMGSSLIWPTENGLALDGYLFLPRILRPTLEDPSVTNGKRLVIGWKPHTELDSNTRRITLRSWRDECPLNLWSDFLFQFSLTTQRHEERLFALGEADAVNHFAELDSIFAELFNIWPVKDELSVKREA